MPRIARMLVKDEPAVYHVISRTALDGFVLNEVEKDTLVKLIRRFSSVYFAEVLGFSVMGNHFHLLVRMHPGDRYSDDAVRERFARLYGEGRELGDGQIPHFREKWANLSEFVKEIKQSFSRFYNKVHGRQGFFWSERFRSVIVENGETLINCLAYIDLNPLRAGIVKRPEAYRWCSLGYHLQTKNKGGFLSLDLGLAEFGFKDERKRLAHYRRFVHEKGGIKDSGQGSAVGGRKTEKGEESDEGHEIGIVDRFRCRTRYFTDSGIIGTKAVVTRIYKGFEGHFSSKHPKQPRAIKGLEGVYALKRLTEGNAYGSSGSQR